MAMWFPILLGHGRGGRGRASFFPFAGRDINNKTYKKKEKRESAAKALCQHLERMIRIPNPKSGMKRGDGDVVVLAGARRRASKENRAVLAGGAAECPLCRAQGALLAGKHS